MKKKIVLVLCVICCKTLATEGGVEFLDYAASWQVSEDVLAEFAKVSHVDGNSSGINPHARYLRQLEKQSAQVIAAKIGAQKADRIHFTNGATAANNIAILGVAYKNPHCHLITSKIEHKSVLNVFKHLEKSGYAVTYLDVDKHGKIDLEQLKRSICNNTKLISIQMFNSEIGTIQDVVKIGEIARKYGVTFHCDAAQAFCKYPIDVEAMKIDLLTVTGHKIGAPKGVGALYIRDSSKLQPIMFGSGDDFVPGTKPTPLICAFAAAVKSFQYDLDKIHENFEALTTELRKLNGTHINSTTPSHVVSVSISGVLLADLLERLPQYSFSAGCSCLGQEKSNVLAAIDPQNELPACTIRISFSDRTSKDMLLTFAQKLRTTVEKLRSEKSVGKGCESETSNINQQDLNYSLSKIQELLKKGE